MSTPQVPTLTDKPTDGPIQGSVTLRAHRPEDAQGSFEQCQDPGSQAWTTVPVPYSMDDAHTFVGEIMPAGWADDSEWAFAVEVEGRYAGTVSLRNEGHGRAEIAYGSHPWVRGTGAMERALRLLLDWGFAEKDLRTVIWWAHVGNWASRRLAWKLGFTIEGAVRAWQPQRGELRDSWVGTLLRGDPREPVSLWLDCPVIDADGFRLRPVEERDGPRIVEACTDERTEHWLGHVPSPYTLDDALTYVQTRHQQRAEATGVTWAVADPWDDRILATIGFFDYTPGVECEIGYWTHPQARGKGLMTRAMGLLTRYAFEELGVRRVKAFAAVENTASRHVIEANGFTQTGIERLGASIRDGRADMALYDMLAEEFSAARR